MADPTARFVITAQDRTAAAIASADRGLKQLGRTATSIRSTMGAFGAVLSGRMFVGWVTNALAAADATAEHATQIRAAQEALTGMKKASADLAVNVGTSLTPAFQGLGKVLQGLNTLIFNADATPFEQQIKDIEESIREMRKHGIDTGIGELLYSKEDQARIAQLQSQLDTLIAKQRVALGFDPAPGAAQDRHMRRTVEGMRRIGDDFDRLGLKRPNIEMDFLADPDGLEEIVVEAREMTVDELLRPFPTAAVRKMFQPLQKESINFAESAGHGLKDSLVDAFMGIEVSWKDMLRRMAIEMALSGIFSTIAGGLAGSTSGIGKFFSNFFGGSRASGGSTRAGMMYKVHPGEAFFTPGQDGHVGKAGGGSSIGTINVDARGATDPAAVQMAVERGVIAAVSIADQRTDAKLRSFHRPAIA